MSKIIRVQFPTGDRFMPSSEKAQDNVLDSREYDYYLVRDDEEVRKGSLAVVDVSGNLKIVRICAVLSRSSKATKYAIAVFSLDTHRELLKKKEDIQALRQAIFERAEESRERQRLEELANSDPQLKTMLDELKQLESGK